MFNHIATYSARLYPFTPRSKLRRLGVPQKPVGLLPCRSLKATRKSPLLLGRQLLSHQRERIYECRMSFAVPSHPTPKGVRCVPHPLMRKQSDQRERSRQSWCRTPYRHVRALPLRLESQVPAHLLESYFQTAGASRTNGGSPPDQPPDRYTDWPGF